MYGLETKTVCFRRVTFYDNGKSSGIGWIFLQGGGFYVGPMDSETGEMSGNKINDRAKLRNLKANKLLAKVRVSITSIRILKLEFVGDLTKDN